MALSACTTFTSEKIDYKSAAKAPTLEVPPDLSQLTRDTRYNVPGGVVSANALQAGQAAQAPTGAQTVISNAGDVRIERVGNERWLVISRPADKLWDPVREFWLENGFVMVKEDAKLGIMETDWAENRAKLPQDAIRAALGKVLDSFYSTGERDKFRTRLERRPDGGTEVYITHRGMIEVYSTQDRDSTAWQPRPSDTELETEFLRRLMVKLGLSQEQSQAAAASVRAAPAAPSARMDTVNNAPVVLLDEGFDRAWRRVGLALDRTGFTVEDRDRSRGIYYVRYVSPGEQKPKGFFSRIFSQGGEVADPVKYQVQVRSEGNLSTVSVLTSAGVPETSANAQRIVRVLTDDLK
nr:outer membrane protein assembly factor BamC [Acidovorax sp. D4N7]